MQKVIITLLFGIVYNCHGSPLYLAVGYYPLTSSTAANDSSLSKNPPGQLANAHPSTGVYGENGGSYSFSGTRSPPSYIRLPSSDALDTRYSITLLAWVYPEGTGGEIISYWQNSSYGVSISIENSRPVFHLYSRDQSNKFTLPSNMKLQSNQWSHIAGSFDNRTGDAILYVDGIKVGSKTGLGSLELQTEYDLWLGYLFKGKLSQIWIFNVSLDKQKIKEVMDFMKSTPSPTSTSSPAYATFASSFAYITAEIATKSLFTHSAQLASQKYVFVSPTVSHTETIRITSTTPLSKPVTVMTQNVSTPVVKIQNISSTPALTNQNVSTTVVTNSQNINSSRVLNSQQATTSSVTPVVDNFRIVEPYPENISALEFTSAQVTCIAFDSTGLKTPERIQFMRKDKFGRYTNVTTNNNTYFTSEAIEVEQGGKKLRKLFVTLHFRNITLEDDSNHSQLVDYECRAFAAGEPDYFSYGFQVYVITRDEIPTVTVSKTSKLQHGDNFTIVCNVTLGAKPSMTSLRTISWYKDGVLKRYLKISNAENASAALGPLVGKNADVEDGGNYTCILQVLLQTGRKHNVSDGSMVQITSWLEKPKQDVEFEKFKGDNVSFECGAKGFPLHVEWKFQKRGEETTQSVTANKVGRYRIERSGIYSPYVLKVFDLKDADCGNYYCCLPLNKSDNVSSTIRSEDCQRFVLWVREACRKKPELVAIIEGGAEVIRGVHENITMNASLSYDPDIGTGNNSGMNFTWNFGQIKGNNYSFPLPGLSGITVQYLAEKGFGPVVIFANKLLLLNETYIMKLVVTKDYRTSSVFQVIRLQNEEPPRVSQSCLLNCGVQTSPSVRLSIKSQCQGSQCSKIFSYEWTLYEQNKSAPNTDPIWRKVNILQSITTTQLNSSNIAIKENSLDGRKNYRLVLFVRTKDGIRGLCAYDIVTATPPSGGRCVIIPSSGISLKTDFNLSCSDWVSDATPLTYQYQYRLDNGLYSMVYYGVNDSVISWLAPGNRSHNYKVEFLATVTNSYGASAPTVNLSVLVEPSQHLSPANFTSVLTSNDSFFNQVIKDGDLNKAAQIANTILEAISRDSSLSTEEKTKIQELIVEKIAALQVKSLPDLLQSSSVIGSAIQDTETTSVKSLEFALPAIESMASLLWNAAQQKHMDDIPLITLSAENLGSCLNNVLKSASIIASGKFGSSLQEQGKTLVMESFRIINIIADAVLAMKVADERVTRIKTTELSMTLGRHTPNKLVGLSIEGGDGRFVLPDEKGTLDSSTGNTAFVDSQMLSIPFNPYTWDVTRELVDSDILALDLKDDERKLIKVSGLPNDVLIVTPLKPQQISLQIPQYFTQNDNLRFHRIDVKYENTLIMVEITPTDESVTLFVYMRQSQRPTTQVYDLNATISKQETCIWWNAQEKSFGRVKCSSNRFTAVPIETVARQPGRYFLGIQSYNTSVTSLKRQKRSCFGNRRQKRSCVQVKDPPPTPPQSKNVSVVPVYDPAISRNYTMRVALGSCVFWSEKLQMWTTEGCQVLSATLNGFLNCSCNHLTSFGGSFFVKPNPIDFDQVLVEFKRLADTGNVAVIVTVAVVFLCYVFVIVFVRKADQQDTRNNGSPVELPTGSNSLHEYEITIITGVWRNSGTTAKVAIEIYGSEESTGKVPLNNMEDSPTGTLFSRGNTDVFVLKVEKPLGSIEGVRFGHDNSGNSPSWFLEEIIVLDKQTLCSWTFTNTQWLALERGDGRIERMLETEQNRIDFNSEVSKRWWKGLTEKHIWVSVLAKPRRNRFTRVQRASCCLSLLLTAMLANAMFYELDGKSENVIQIGPLKFTWRQVVIGIESALIVAPINILISFLFQKGTENTASQTRVCWKANCLIYFAWFLFVCSCSVSATFTIFYSLLWGKEISEQWLSSMFISFTQDMAITEPFKVFFTAIVLSAIIIRKKRKRDGSEYVKEAKTRTSTKGHLWKMKLKDVEEMRRRQAKKQNISRFFVELFIYLIFVFLLMVVCYGSRNEHRYMMTKSVTEGLPKFEAVINKKQYWSWIKNVFLPGVFASRWYNGRPENQTMYIGNKRSVLVGMARGSQLRAQPETCEVLDYMKHMFPVCYGGYSRLNEDKTSFNKPGWKPVDNSTNNDELFRLCPKPWRYQSAADTDTVPKWGQFSFYPGGGFVADLGYENSTGFTVIETLQNNDWLDRRTRVIILEFSFFNPSVNLLCIATYFFELEASGYSAPFTRTEVISLDSTEAGSQQFYLICILFFIIFVAFYLGRECYRLYKQRSRYFKSLWGWVEIFQVLFSLLAVVMYIVRSKKATSTIQKLQKNIYANLSFQEVIISLEIENAALGILTFIITAKLLRLIRFNQHVVVFSKTLKTSARLLSSFTVVMLICFTAFLHFGVLIFGTGSRHYSSILRAMYFQLELTLGRVKARPINELADANDTFGRIFAVLLLFTLTILAMNFFIAIMNHALMNAKTCASENELYDLLDENWSQKEGENKRIFDAISESIKQTKGNDEIVKMTKTEIRNCGENPNKKCVVNFDAISKAIMASREDIVENLTEKKFNANTRRKSLFDKISDYILKTFTSSEEHKIQKELRSSHSQQRRKVRFSEDVIKCQFQKLQKQKKFLFQRLDNIIQGHSDEEDKFQLLCYEVGYSSKETTTVADQGATNDSYA